MRVSLFLNHACNLRCTYCYNGEKFARAMPWEVAERGVALALDEPGPARVSFFGGEPLMERELMRRVIDAGKALAASRKRALGFLVVTNATLLDEPTLDWLLDEGVHIGLSLDGSQRAHDAARVFAGGGGSWAVASENARRVFARAPGTKVIAVIHPGNVRWLAESFVALLDLGAINLSMNVDYEAEWDDAAREALVESLAALGDAYVAAYRAGRRFTLNLIDSKVITHLKGGYADSDRCDFGTEEVAISPTGRFYPCDRLVGEDDREDLVIGDVWRGFDVERRAALITEKHTLSPECEGCALRARCMNWCGCINYGMTGSVGEVDGLLCWLEQVTIEAADRAAEVLYQEEDQGFIARFYAPRRRRLLAQDLKLHAGKRDP
ncbi:MAG: radical SAM protein [Deltaproteobacteria bacterium]|nr:radical SAM protein [Deltaproteobacteria bacterium]